MTNDKKAFLSSDGGSRGNPGPSAGAAVLWDENKKEIAREGVYCGRQTNNFAEYAGLICGLNLAFSHSVTDLEVILDSKLIAEQMNGNYKAKNPNIRPSFEKAKLLAGKFHSIKFRHVLRTKNKVADSIVNEVLDAHC